MRQAARWARSLAAMACALACSCASALPCPAQVHVAYPDFEVPPFINGSKQFESPAGDLVEWTQAALAKTGCASVITMRRLPPKRLIAEMQSGAIDITPGLGYTPERLDDMDFPLRDGAINTDLVVVPDSISLYVRSDEQNVKWDGVQLQAPNGTVGISAKIIFAEAIARKQGWQVDVAPYPQANVKKLLVKRIDVILEPDVLLLPYLAGGDAQTVRKLVPPALIVNRYAPVAKHFQQQFPEFTRRFWLELCKQSRPMFPTLPDCR